MEVDSGGERFSVEAGEVILTAGPLPRRNCWCSQVWGRRSICVAWESQSACLTRLGKTCATIRMCGSR